eukprot:860409_1
MFLATLNNNSVLPVIIISLDHPQPNTICAQTETIASQQIVQCQQYQSPQYLQNNNLITFNNNPSSVHLSNKRFTNNSTQSVSLQSNNINSHIKISNINRTHIPMTQFP